MVKRYLSLALLLTGTLFLNFGCSGSEDDQPCDSSSMMITEDNICLTFEHDGLTDNQKTTIENKISTAITEINKLMPIDNIQIRIVNNPGFVIPEIGIGGYNPSQQEAIIAIDVNFSAIDNALEEDLVPMLAHEIHHAKRRRSVGYGSTLLQAAVTEGLADHFSIQLTGISPPPWSIAITGTDLQDLIDSASNTWNEPSYNHNTWFFGTDPNIPRWAGYSIGFELVSNYLANNPGKLPSDLHNEPASSFEP